MDDTNIQPNFDKYEKIIIYLYYFNRFLVSFCLAFYHSLMKNQSSIQIDSHLLV